MAAADASPGAGVGGRAASMAGITGMIGRAAGMRGRDPVRRQRARLRVEAAEIAGVEREIEDAVAAAVAAARASLEEVPA